MENKDQDIEDTYNSIFLESKLFKNRKAISELELADIANFAYMNLVGLWVMYNESVTKSSASAYADRTISFGNFNTERNMATDLYVAINTLIKEDTVVSSKLADKESNSALRMKLHINQGSIKSFLEDMASVRLSDNDAARFLLKAQRMFNITDINYKSMGRSAHDWTSLSDTEKSQLIRKISRFLNSHARRSELKSMFDDLLNIHSSDDTVDDKKHTGIKTLAAAAAGLYGGYKLGKLAAKIIDAKRLMR
jgi:hypothetical protein